MNDALPDISALVGLNKENSWSDLLASFITIDPDPFFASLGVPRPDGAISVGREVPLTAGSGSSDTDKKGRIDLIVYVDRVPWAVIEAKVLAGFGPGQLGIYAAAYPSAAKYLIAYSSGLGLNGPRPLTTIQGVWLPTAWEQLIQAYTVSASTWVSQTARAWAVEIARLIPEVSADTRWADVGDSDLVGALRSRMNWISNEFDVPAGAVRDMVTAGGGRSPVVRAVIASQTNPAYEYSVEAQEGLGSRYFSAPGVRLMGPQVKVFLHQKGVKDSKSFDWDGLFHMWQILERRGESAGWAWDTRHGGPKAIHDRTNFEALLAARGMPRTVGFGYGEAQAKISKSVLFGARMSLPPDVTMRVVADTLGQLSDCLSELAAVPLGAAAGS